MQTIIHDSPAVSFQKTGWNQYWQEHFEEYKGPYLPGRVCTVHKTRCEVITPGGIMSVPVSGAMKSRKVSPVVGDFVVILHQPDIATEMIVALLPRKTVLSRGGAGEFSGEQVLAANIDTVFIVTDPGHDLSIPRIERYLLLVHQAGCQPVVILNKSDTCDEIMDSITQVQVEIRGVPIIALSAQEKTGLDQLDPYLTPGTTVVFLGSSGVGKSTLVNAISGITLQKTGDIREDDGRGRHTTTVRHLYPLPQGYSLIDTPGLREIRVWTAAESIAETFEDIHLLATRCRFSDCTHDAEPGCAVRQAVEEGVLTSDRLLRYQKILKEIAFEREKSEIGLKRFEKKKCREISKTVKAIYDSGTGKPKW